MLARLTLETTIPLMSGRAFALSLSPLMATIPLHLLIHVYIIRAAAHQIYLHLRLLLTPVCCCVSFISKAAGSELHD